MKKLLLLAIIIPLCLTGCSFSLLPTTPGSSQATGSKGVFKTGNQGTNWLERNTLEDGGKINRLDARQLAFDIFDSNVLYLGTNKGLYISENSADSWRPLIKDSNINTFVLNPKTRGIIYVASGAELYKTVDNGVNWNLIYTEARPDVSISSIAISHFDTSFIYILTTDGVLMMSSDWGESWQQVYSFKSKTSQILIDPNNSQNMYVAFDKGLYCSIDEGKTWVDILQAKNKEYPGISSFKQLFFTAEAGRLIYLSQYGILKSQDKGDSWQPLSLITPSGNVEISTLAFNPNNEDELYYIVNNILYQTLDGGHNWKTKVVPVGSRAQANQLLIDNQDPNIFYLGITSQ